MTDNRTYEEFVTDVLSRYSVRDLVEQTADDLAAGDERFYKSTADFHIAEQGQEGGIQWWKIASGDNEYECRRFKNFVFCSCKSFFFSKKICKHLALTAHVRCVRCHEVSAKVGKLCYDCDYIVNRFGSQRTAPAISQSQI